MHRWFAGLALTAAVVGGCGQFDDTAAFQVVNDGAIPVRVYQCGNTCGQRHDNARLAPGETLDLNASVGGPTEYVLVVDPSKPTAECLSVLIRHTPRAEPRIPTSGAEPCSKRMLGPGGWWDRTFG